MSTSYQNKLSGHLGQIHSSNACSIDRFASRLQFLKSPAWSNRYQFFDFHHGYFAGSNCEFRQSFRYQIFDTFFCKLHRIKSDIFISNDYCSLFHKFIVFNRSYIQNHSLAMTLINQSV